MKIMQWLIFLIGIGLIIARGFWSEVFTVDFLSVVILFILSIPFVAHYLRKAKIFGAEFEFKDEIREVYQLVQQSVEKAAEEEAAGKKIIFPFETFKLTNVKELVDSDPVLALAALRIEIERKLRLLAYSLDVLTNKEWSLSRIINSIRHKELLSYEKVEALQKIVNMCNKAIHGAAISKEEAKEIIDLADELNRSFAIGYSIDFSPNLDYETYGLLCEWEHCIELMLLTPERTRLSCPVLGHNCPGGVKKISKCGKTINDVPSSRFTKE